MKLRDRLRRKCKSDKQIRAIIYNAGRMQLKGMIALLDGIKKNLESIDELKQPDSVIYMIRHLVIDLKKVEHQLEIKFYKK